MAWIRSLPDYEELVFCSDSRLRFGCAWDSCQKVFPLPRGDCAITFAGDTQFAYPFIHSAINAVSYHRGSKKRLVDLTEVKPVLLNALNSMLAEIRDLAKGKEVFDDPDLRLIFGGYSWKKKRFIIWKFFFNHGERSFRHGEVKAWKGLGAGRKLLILGDPEASRSASRRASRLNESPPDPENDVEALAKRKLLDLLEARGLKDGQGLDMEPLEVLLGLLRDNSSPYIGGPPQMVKVYQHLNAQAFGVRWPDASSGRVAMLGRLLPYGEKTHAPVMNPSTLRVERAEQHQSNGAGAGDS